MKNKRSNSQAGFTLLLAALVASVVLALGAAIFSLAQKQFTLSSIGRDSQFAFYAADTAAECALYWDFRFSYFASTTPASVVPECDMLPMNSDNTNFNPGGRPDPYTYTMTSARMNFFQDASPLGGYCAEASVTKCQGTFSADGTCTSDPAGAIRTVIHANGYSVNCDSIQTSSRALQRSVELHY
ncbi:hypothetical protein A2851_04160 [Candidatus Kaiserbacteria bacterium RIFCSPHIGHO2_01_FULL_53_29]|uniref:Type 4 fimbrial biogenesis protein PilX N-terminal domain-containing protein n=1 Tax=Candidatus Kaiserbacteria bacterium RIFCSPHIGHO2_01_FULL_53_29 TaxID=1798480 RepID=A0A1F6CWE3_9BACT|nr:MAG: hypothetical protein A2851_04160 [Candidatus Kaiserbacteria bacterium RIFCSPHIGHO2_01_FULL_53_29]